MLSTGTKQNSIQGKWDSPHLDPNSGFGTLKKSKVGYLSILRFFFSLNLEIMLIFFTIHWKGNCFLIILPICTLWYPFSFYKNFCILNSFLIIRRRVHQVRKCIFFPNISKPNFFHTFFQYLKIHYLGQLKTCILWKLKPVLRIRI